MKIIQASRLVECVAYSRDFDRAGESGCGWSFPYDAHGSVDESALPALAAENYRKCLSGTLDGARTIDRGIRKSEWTYHEPAVGLCNHCGREVVLAGFTNSCECGADYHGAGQELVSREQWGEETGEHWSECVGPFTGEELDR